MSLDSLGIQKGIRVSEDLVSALTNTYKLYNFILFIFLRDWSVLKIDTNFYYYILSFSCYVLVKKKWLVDFTNFILPRNFNI